MKARRSFGPLYRELSLCGRAISPSSKLVLIHLLERLGIEERNRENAWPTLETIAAGVGFDERTVRRSLEELRTLGLVNWKRRGRGESNLYTVQVEALDRWYSERKNGQYVQSEADPRTDIESNQERTLSPLSPDNMSVLERTLSPTEDPSLEDPSLNGLQCVGREPALPPLPAKALTKAFIEDRKAKHPELDIDGLAERYRNHKAFLNHRNKQRGFDDWIRRERSAETNGREPVRATATAANREGLNDARYR